MATTEQGTSSPASPSEVGRHLRSVRKSKGLSRTEVARSAGLTRRELAAYERGKSPVPDSDLWCLAGSCGVDVNELLPHRDRLGIGSDLGALTVGESVRRLRPGQGSDGVLREYIAMIYELRNLPPGTRPPMRDEDLATLADALGGTADAIEARLHELIGASRDEAARLRSMILPPRSIAPAAPPAPPMHALPSLAVPGAPPMAAVPVGGAAYSAAYGAAPPPPGYPPPSFDFATAPNSIGNPAAADRFFDAPKAEDPFAPPPPLAPLDSLAPLAPTTPTAFSAAGSIPPPPLGPPPMIDPYAPPTVPPIDPFAPPTAAPVPDDVAPRPDGFVADLGTLDADPYGAHTVPAAPHEPADAFLDDHFPAEHPDVDAFGAGEIVVLDVGPDGSVIDAYADAAHGFDDADSPGDAPDEAVDDDPFAALRVPLDELDEAAVGAIGEVGEIHALDADTTGSEPSVDAFADAYTSAHEPGAEAVEDPGDDWFDRAAAAADALIAEQRIESDDIPSTEPGEMWIDVAPTVDAHEVAEEPSSLDGFAATWSPVEPEASFDPTSGPLADDGPLVADLVRDGVADRPASDDPDPALPPISWSLYPPVVEPPVLAPVVAEPEARPGPEPALVQEYVTAGPDWQIGGIFPATAMADDGTLALRRADVRWALADLVADGDCTVVATVNFTSGAGFGILFRVSSDDSERITGYSFDVDPVYSGGGFLIRQWNDSRQHWKPLAHAPVADTARLYGVHVIEVGLHHDALVARIDGETVMSVPQLSRASIDAGHEPCRGNRVGVQAWSTTEVTVDRMMLARP